MEQKDFILKEIEKLSAILKTILGKMQEHRNPSIELENLEKELNSEFSITIQEFLDIEYNSFDSFFIKHESLDLSNIELFAGVLAQYSTNHQKKAIDLYQYLDEKTKPFSYARSLKIQNLQNSLY